MQIDTSSTTTTQNPVTATNTAQGTADATNAAIDSTNSLGNENTFLQLLVAQIQNQDPTQPVDSTTFLTQLAQFSSLEQLIGIRQDVGQLDPASGTTDPTATTSTTATGTTQN